MPANTSDQCAGPNNHLLSLRDIASWQNIPGVAAESPFKASIPALQRGLVWKPDQNELLWDSILRGFPIGALVVTKWSDKLKKTTEVTDDSIQSRFHLLDGQQRCNAIAMGFSDPFESKEPTGRKKVESILWLDVNPDPKMQRNSTRNFWVRVTTTAHPWGYYKDDSATPLGVWDMRKALELVGLNFKDPTYRRPSPVELWPGEAAARIPVPLSWLLKIPLEDESTFWKTLGLRASAATGLLWSSKIHEFCVSPEDVETKSRVFNAIKMAHAARVIAIEAPEDLIGGEGSEQERSNGGDREDVSNIEQLFQRLNQQGTKLDGEELAYSMIKAYWPDLEVPINEVSKGRMPEARMVSLGVRAALANVTPSKDAKQNLPGPLTVSALRSIARSERGKKEIIQKFIAHDLRSACERVDIWLKYDETTNPSGLLPVHITSIAMSSREVYLLLLHFAAQMDGKEGPEGWGKAMQALATLIHWFSPEKAKVANRVYAHCRDDLNIGNIQHALAEAIEEEEMHRLQTPKATRTFLQRPTVELKNWHWESLTHIEGDDALSETLRKTWDGFLTFRDNRELLLYAQRDFLMRRWDYDPARKDLWEAHNRPWDFDHISASYYFYNRKDGSPYRGICGQWGYTIGNLRAWPFEDNRSDQHETASEKIEGDPARQRDSFLTPEEELGFSGGDDVRWKENTAQLFVDSCRDRLLRIYDEWYSSVGIAALIPFDDRTE